MNPTVSVSRYRYPSPTSTSRARVSTVANRRSSINRSCPDSALSRLDLQLRLVAARARREDVENHLGAVHDAHAEALLELDALHRRQRLVEQHQRRAGGGEVVLQRFDLALAQIEVRGGGIDALDGLADYLSSRRIRQALQLLEMLVD